LSLARSPAGSGNPRQTGDPGQTPDPRTAPGEGETAEQPSYIVGPHILRLSEELDPGDRTLGDLLRSLDLVDADTLASLLAEARGQHRSLRQALLAGGYLT